MSSFAVPKVQGGSASPKALPSAMGPASTSRICRMALAGRLIEALQRWVTLQCGLASSSHWILTFSNFGYSLLLLQVLQPRARVETCLLVQNRNLKTDAVLTGSKYGLSEARSVIMKLTFSADSEALSLDRPATITDCVPRKVFEEPADVGVVQSGQRHAFEVDVVLESLLQNPVRHFRGLLNYRVWNSRTYGDAPQIVIGIRNCHPVDVLDKLAQAFDYSVLAVGPEASVPFVTFVLAHPRSERVIIVFPEELEPKTLVGHGAPELGH